MNLTLLPTAVLPMQPAVTKPSPPPQAFGMVVTSDDSKKLQAVADYANDYFALYAGIGVVFSILEDNKLKLDDDVINSFCATLNGNGQTPLTLFKRYLEQKGVEVTVPPVLTDPELRW